jgi:hypothetical protein
VFIAGDDAEATPLRLDVTDPASAADVAATVKDLYGKLYAWSTTPRCTGWRYVAEELAAAGVEPDVAEPADTAFARGRKRHAKTDKTDSRHLRELLAEGRLPECWVAPPRILECRALLETYHDLRAEYTAWVQRIHAVFFHQGARPWPRCAPGTTSRRLGRPPPAACRRPGSCRWLSRWTCSPPSRPSWTRCGASCCSPPGA